MTLLLKSRWPRLGHLPTEVETPDLCRFFQYLLRFSWMMVSDMCAIATYTCFSVKSKHQESFSSSNLEQLLSKIFRAGSENPEHPERLSCRKSVFLVRLSTMGSESWKPSRLRFCNLKQWNRRPGRVHTSITEFDRSRCCRQKGLKYSTNNWSINDHGQWKATTHRDRSRPTTSG